MAHFPTSPAIVLRPPSASSRITKVAELGSAVMLLRVLATCRPTLAEGLLRLTDAVSAL